MSGLPVELCKQCGCDLPGPDFDCPDPCGCHLTAHAEGLVAQVHLDANVVLHRADPSFSSQEVLSGVARAAHAARLKWSGVDVDLLVALTDLDRPTCDLVLACTVGLSEAEIRALDGSGWDLAPLAALSALRGLPTEGPATVHATANLKVTYSVQFS